MPKAQEILDQQFLEMRWRCLSLAADLDRIDRAAGGYDVRETDLRLKRLKQAIRVLLSDSPDRAETMQNIFSDKTPVER